MLKRALIFLPVVCLLIVTAGAAQAQAIIPPQPDASCFFIHDVESSGCLPSARYPIQSAYQPFENGFMLWRADSGEVWVFEKSGAVLRYPEDIYAVTPDNPITTPPPSGRSAPAQGFGRVWGNFASVRHTLGWALGPEVGYTMTIQFTRYPFYVPYFYMTLPNGAVTKILNSGRWTLETP